MYFIRMILKLLSPKLNLTVHVSFRERGHEWSAARVDGMKTEWNMTLKCAPSYEINIYYLSLILILKIKSKARLIVNVACNRQLNWSSRNPVGYAIHEAHVRSDHLPETLNMTSGLLCLSSLIWKRLSIASNEFCVEKLIVFSLACLCGGLDSAFEVGTRLHILPKRYNPYACPTSSARPAIPCSRHNNHHPHPTRSKNSKYTSAI